MLQPPCRTRLRRLAVLAILLGVVTNCAVTVACAAWLDPAGSTYSFQRTTMPSRSVWGAAVERSEMKQPGVHRRHLRYVPARANPAPNPMLFYSVDLKQSRRMSAASGMRRWGESSKFLAQPLDPLPAVQSQLEEASGFPFLCFYWSAERGPSITPPGKDWRLLGGIELAPDTRSTSIANIRALPLRPIWPGLLLNTLLHFYAALWSIPLTLIPTLRRRHRRKHQRCERCAYDLHNLTTTTCPECGSPFPLS